MTKTNDILDNLPTYWKKDSTSKNYKFITSFDDNFQDVSDQTANLKLTIQLNTSTGQALTDLGAIFALNRNADESDNDYRARIKAYWPGFSGGGTIVSIKQTVNRMTGIPEDDVNVIEFHSGTYIQPLKVVVEATVPSLGTSVNVVSEVLQSTKAAGVYIIADISGETTDVYGLYTDTETSINTNTLFYPNWAKPNENTLK